MLFKVFILSLICKIFLLIYQLKIASAIPGWLSFLVIFPFYIGNIKSIFVFLHFVATVTISWCILPSYYYFALKRTNHMLSENFASLFHEFHLFPSGQRAQTSLYECSHHTTCLELVCSEWLSTENYKNKYSLWKLFNVP